ncbi:MAG TPA: M20/M25/M40 family metallo-hydrolase [Candidatus Saccharimonadales bacterium]|nr:M20/M25/M40 family metallo-hydrolase [Candidatus Saccharimonadales bacterium]
MTPQEIVEQTKQLIAIASTGDNPVALRQAVDFVVKMVNQHCPDITTERFDRGSKPSFLAYRGRIRPKKFDILLNGHVDVVPAKPEQFKAYEKDGRLYGRGALDMKGTALVLAEAFCKLVHDVPYKLGLQIVSDEEVGGYDGVRLQIDEGVRANFVIMGEYANDRHTIYNAARGLCWAEILFKGKTAHGGHLWNGTNAVVKAGDFAGAVLKRYPTPDKEAWTTTASIASLSTTNETYNKVPDTAVLKIDFRFTQEDPVFQSRESLEAFVHSIDPEARIVNLATFEPAVNVERLNPYVQGMSAAMHKATGVKPRFLGRPASSDGRHFALVHNDIVEFGIYGQGSHSDHEYAEIASFAEYQQILHEFLRRPIPSQLQRETIPTTPLHEDLLRQLVAMPTATSDRAGNNKALVFVEHFLQTRGMHVERLEKNGIRSIIATTAPHNKRPKVLLNAHIDAVPADESMLRLQLKSGKYYGRGVMDMKHAVAAFLTVVDRLKDELDEHDFGLMITSDEEIGSANSVPLLLFEYGYRPEVVIVPDGGNDWKLETFAKGVQWIELQASGKAAHASRPWEGESAIRRLLAALQEIETLSLAEPQPTDTLISVGTIAGGTTANQIPASASAMLDIRTGSTADHEAIPRKIHEICKRHGVIDTSMSNEPPSVTDPNHPLVKPMIDIITGITGRTHGTTYDYAATDGRFFTQAGIPTIVINPACGGIHTEKEWLSRRGFTQFCLAIEQYVRQISKTSRPLSAPVDVAELAKRLNSDNKPAYIWYANYGSGLSKENFMCQVRGGTPKDSTRTFAGCSDSTPPQRDQFMSLPYALYFAGDCAAWGGGGHINIQPELTHSAHTIARAYLITVEQFEEIVAQQNDRRIAKPLPIKQAILQGHATVGRGTGHYDELVFCGIKDDAPVFTLTAVRPELPYVAPSQVYARLLCKGLSENTNLDRQTAIDYMLATPGIAGNYQKQELDRLFKEATDIR